MRTFCIQLHVTQSGINNKDYVSKYFHIFDNDKSLCKKYVQDTDNLDTDYYIRNKHLTAKCVQDIIENHNKYLCPKCAKAFKLQDTKDLTI